MNSQQGQVTFAFAIIGGYVLWRRGWLPTILGWLRAPPGGHVTQDGGTSQAAAPLIGTPGTGPGTQVGAAGPTNVPNPEQAR